MAAMMDDFDRLRLRSGGSIQEQEEARGSGETFRCLADLSGRIEAATRAAWSEGPGIAVQVTLSQGEALFLEHEMSMRMIELLGD